MPNDPTPAQPPGRPAHPRHGGAAGEHRRAAAVVVVVAAVATVVLVLAASSGPFEVWQLPTSDTVVSTQITDPSQEVESQQPVPDGRREWPRWVDTLSRAIAMVVVAAAIAVVLMLLRFLRVPAFIRYARLGRQAASGEVLPEIDEHVVKVDVASARAALVGGTPRNAIVACWMQLERDAADAGLPRAPSETPTEYAERVIGGSSVDRAPIAELAALYREARFSRHELGDDHRRRALAALERVADALHHDARHHDARATGVVGA